MSSHLLVLCLLEPRAVQKSTVIRKPRALKSSQRPFSPPPGHRGDLHLTPNTCSFQPGRMQRGKRSLIKTDLAKVPDTFSRHKSWKRSCPGLTVNWTQPAYVSKLLSKGPVGLSQSVRTSEEGENAWHAAWGGLGFSDAWYRGSGWKVLDCLGSLRSSWRLVLASASDL